jgi:hypothetical protein
MLILTVLGFLHLRRVPAEREVFTAQSRKEAVTASA